MAGIYTLVSIAPFRLILSGTVAKLHQRALEALVRLSDLALSLPLARMARIRPCSPVAGGGWAPTTIPPPVCQGSRMGPSGQAPVSKDGGLVRIASCLIALR